MKIRVLLIVTGGVLLMLLVALWSIYLFNSSEQSRARENRTLAISILRDVQYLSTLTHEFVLYGGDRSHTQWLTKQANLATFLREADFSEEEEKATIADLQASNILILDYFNKLEEIRSGSNINPLQEELRNKLLDDIMLRLQDMTSQAIYLSDTFGNKVAAAQGNAALLTNISMLLVIGYLVFISVIIWRRLVRPLTMLEKATSVIASGNLDYRVGISSRDEIGDLSRSFNLMAGKLRDSYQALKWEKDALDVRVRERTRDLLESEQRFRIGAASASDLLWDWDIISGSLEWFGDVDTMLGFDQGLFSRTIDAWSAVIHEEDRGHVDTSLARHLQEGNPYSEEYRVVRKDGAIRYWTDRGETLRDAKGKPYRMIGACTDVTERKLIENSLRESEGKYRNLFHNAEVAMYRSRMDGSALLDINTKLCELFGYSREEMLSKPASIRWADPIAREDMVKQVREKGSVSNYEMDILTRANKRKTCLISVRLFPLEGTIEGTAYDITELRSAARSLAAKTEQLERSNNELQSFAYVASHDLQEPLRTISSYMQLLERRYKPKLDKDAQEFIDIAVAGANRLQIMIGGLLEYSRVETRGDPFERVNCESVLRHVVGDLKKSIEESKAEITYDSLPEVFADEVQLTRLFQNLVVNSIRYHGSKPPRIHVSAAQQNGEYVFAVRDNGIGIDPEYKEQIFVIFQRLQGREVPGIGLGLAVAKKIVERHGGRIWVESEPGKGAIFYFTIPIKGGDQA